MTVRSELTGDMQAAVAAQTGTTAHLFSLEFSGGTIRMATLPHDVVWDGETWSGVGGLMGFEPIEEGTDLKATGLSLILSGVEQTVIAALLGQNYRGRPVEVYRAKFNASGGIIADPLKIFSGKLNSGFEIREMRSEDAQGGTVEVRTQCVSDMAVLVYSQGIRTNLASHQQVESADTFFQNINAIPDLLTWGTNRSRVVRKGGSPPGGASGPDGLGWH